ncbi:hypothetical protein [Demetria terragena]|uniref:hypothetical protein n=1 Tax=Demetria terragena TaxID=63959 RepID=UPI000375208E|nr:hypothetical protein [Demetria terragena]
MTEDQTPVQAPEPTAPTPEPATSPPDRINLDLPPREPTGDADVDHALAALDDVSGAGLQEHLEAVEAAQGALQQRLADTRG